MPYKNKADKNANARLRYATDPVYRAKVAARQGKWVVDNKPSIQATHQSRRADGRATAAEYRYRLKKFGLVEDQMARSWGQETHCRSCGCTDPQHKKGFAIDHDHETGRVRGIVCMTCNSIAGLASDNSDRLRIVANYLEAA